MFKVGICEPRNLCKGPRAPCSMIITLWKNNDKNNVTAKPGIAKNVRYFLPQKSVLTFYSVLVRIYKTVGFKTVANNVAAFVPKLSSKVFQPTLTIEQYNNQVKLHA